MFDVENFEKIMSQKGSFEAIPKDNIEVDGHHISWHVLVKKVRGKPPFMNDEYYLSRYTEDVKSGRCYVEKYTYHIANGRIECIPCEKDSTDEYISYFNLDAILLSWQISRYLINKTNATSLGCCDIFCETVKYIQNKD